jgi:hypothetical protein
LAVPDTAGALDELALAVAELEPEVGAEVEELLLHPAASPVHAMVSRATIGALSLVMDRIISRTLPLIVA